MSPITGLLKKDFKISRWLFFTSLILLLIVLGAGFGYSSYAKQHAGTFVIFILSGVALILYTPLMMFSVLKIEGKNQLWLYSPRSSLTLLLSKFIVILTYQVILQILLSIYGAISLYWFGKSVYEQIGVGFFIEAIVYLNIFILLLGIFFSCWICFYWAFYHACAHYPKLKPFRWLIILAMFIAYNIFEGLLLKITIINDWMTKFSVKIISTPEFSYEKGDWVVNFGEGTIPVLPFLYYVILSIILVLAAARLLERKVEV
ncbi:hypothetical protein CHH83_06405 [Bacillus sp. 7586-K]|nr:hypothetical protein CHH83_06405 [Bacillus sp. 7586-K]